MKTRKPRSFHKDGIDVYVNRSGVSIRNDHFDSRYTYLDNDKQINRVIKVLKDYLKWRNRK